MIAYGVAVGMGHADPGVEYFRAVADSDAEATLLHAQYVARKQAAENDNSD